MRRSQKSREGKTIFAEGRSYAQTSFRKGRSGMKGL